jgi:hypothetical protein
MNNESKYSPDICLQGLRKTMKSITRDSRSPGHDLNPGLPEYEAGVLTILPRFSDYYSIIIVALGGVVVSVLATGPKVAGSNLAEDDGF